MDLQNEIIGHSNVELAMVGFITCYPSTFYAYISQTHFCFC